MMSVMLQVIYERKSNYIPDNLLNWKRKKNSPQSPSICTLPLVHLKLWSCASGSTTSTDLFLSLRLHTTCPIWLTVQLLRPLKASGGQFRHNTLGSEHFLCILKKNKSSKGFSLYSETCNLLESNDTKLMSTDNGCCKTLCSFYIKKLFNESV